MSAIDTWQRLTTPQKRMLVAVWMRERNDPPGLPESEWPAKVQVGMALEKKFLLRLPWPSRDTSPTHRWVLTIRGIDLCAAMRQSSEWDVLQKVIAKVTS